MTDVPNVITTIEQVRRLSREDPAALVAAKDEGRLDLARVIASQQAERDQADARKRRIRDLVLVDGVPESEARATVQAESDQQAAKVAAADAARDAAAEELRAIRAARAGA
jgi:hypothetical protein